MAKAKPTCDKCGEHDFEVKSVGVGIWIVYCANCGKIVGAAGTT